MLAVIIVVNLLTLNH